MLSIGALGRSEDARCRDRMQARMNPLIGNP